MVVMMMNLLYLHLPSRHAADPEDESAARSQNRKVPWRKLHDDDDDDEIIMKMSLLYPHLFTLDQYSQAAGRVSRQSE